MYVIYTQTCLVIYPVYISISYYIRYFMVDWSYIHYISVYNIISDISWLIPHVCQLHQLPLLAPYPWPKRDRWQVAGHEVSQHLLGPSRSQLTTGEEWLYFADGKYPLVNSHITMENHHF